MDFYDFEAERLDGSIEKMEKYKDKEYVKGIKFNMIETIKDVFDIVMV